MKKINIKKGLKRLFHRADTQIRFGKEKVKKSDKLIDCVRNQHTIKYEWDTTIKKKIVGANLQEVFDNLISSKIHNNDIQRIRLTGKWCCEECDNTLEFEPLKKKSPNVCSKCGSELEVRREGLYCQICKKKYMLELIEKE